MPVVRLCTGMLCCLLSTTMLRAEDASRSADIAAATSPSSTQTLSVRYAIADNGTPGVAPDFQRHIGPLLGRLGCNGRACHGSFQGRGGFQLSLFGYDFAADHLALTSAEAGRVNPEKPEKSMILVKPTDADQHEGGKRMDVDSWQYRVLRHWIAAGAKPTGKLHSLKRLEVQPQEILVQRSGERIPLRAIAHWNDGTIEDVTELCRFSTNDDVIAEISEEGVVESHESGDTHVVVAYDKAVVPVAVMQPTSQDLAQINPPRSSSHPIDQLVQSKLDKLRIVPSPVCNDSDFIRRATLDITGLLPSPERVTAFLSDQRPDKRNRLIDELLEEPGYAAWWAVRLSDWTGNNEVQMNNYFPARGAASRYWYAWIEKRLADNVTYDQIVEGLVDAESRLPGESYTEYCETMSAACRNNDDEVFASRPGVPQYWARNNFRMPEDRAVGFAYSFLGIRIQCAQCHKHPFDLWSKDDFDKFAVLFSSIQANSNSVEKDSKETQQALLAQVTGGKEIRGGDLRKRVAEAVKEGQTVPFPELLVIHNMRKREPVDKVANVRPAEPTQDDKEKMSDAEMMSTEMSDVMSESMNEMSEVNSSDSKAADPKSISEKDKKALAAAKAKAEKANAEKAKAEKNKKKQAKPEIAKGSILGEFEEIALVSDPRNALMDWLRRPDNPYFAKAIVNRVWANYFGIGIVNPTDDMNLGNPPSNQALLDYLAEGFIEHDYDLKWLHREITTSDTYQRSATANASNARDTRNFSRHVPHRLPAEVVRDAIYLATANDAEANQARQTLDKLAINGEVGGYAKQGSRDFALQVFGQSLREANCDCDRSDQSNLLQSIYLQNDTDIHRQLGDNNGWVNRISAAYALSAKAPSSIVPPVAGKSDKRAMASSDLLARLLKQYQRYRGLPEKRQEKMRAELDQEIASTNERLAKLGQAAISFDDLASGNVVRNGTSAAAQEESPLPSSEPSKLNADATEWIESAYLRTLCRYPDAEETRISLEFIQQARSPQAGLQSVMWTLLNTKEFLLSH